ncbi:SprT family zinc-dependent metalloprotease [Ruegeria conchae]|uniref:M48 family metallopeptidase n=1 Tax=Ruegeria conchae TaxID=981384 RepID=UPI0029C689D2|nr:SprT family zinc-dependent metalloprotease [Ruegeria conchae]
MNTEWVHIAGVDIEVVQKPIKNLHIGVYPPDGRVRVAAPPSMSADAVRIAVLTRLPWIERKRLGFLQQARETERQYVSGETHWFFGRPLRLHVDEINHGRHRVYPDGATTLRMRVAETTDWTARNRLVHNWYRRELRDRSQDSVAKWARTLEVPEPRCGIKRMRTKWGSCNPSTGRIWLNLSLAKKPLNALDYVVLHEVAHFVSPRHDEAFINVLDRFMPNWRQVRRDLNSSLLDSWTEQARSSIIA